jgi:hypothetical protein
MNKSQIKTITALTLLHFLITLSLHTIAWVYALSSSTTLETIIVWLGTAITFPIFYFLAELIGKEFMGGAGLLFALLLNSLLWVSSIYFLFMYLRQKKGSYNKRAAGDSQ